jgi:hypothetical protein
MWIVGLEMCYLLGIGLLLFLVWTAGVFCLASTAAAFGFCPKRVFAIWIGMPVLVIVVLICMLVAWSFYHAIPTVVFRDLVGFNPTQDVTIVNSFQLETEDWSDSYLEFYASDSTISRILQNGFAPILPADIVEYGAEPAWWSLPAGPTVRVYATNTGDRLFRDKNFRWAVPHKLMVYGTDNGDPNIRHVYFRYRQR